MKKKLLLLFCISVLFLTGCSSLTISSGDTDLNPKKIHINFKAFATTNTNEVNTLSINEINMDGFTSEEIVKIKQNVSTVYDTLGDYTYFMSMIGKNEEYYNKVSKYFDYNFLEILKNRSNDYIEKSMNTIYKKEKCKYFKTNIIEIKRENNKEFKVIIQLLAVQNNNVLYGKKDTLTFTNNYLIKNIENTSDWEKINNSTTPISENDYGKVNEKFYSEFTSLLSSISNKYIYEQYHSLKNNTITYKTKEEKLEKEKEITLQIETLLEKDNYDIEILKKLFLSGEGTFENYGITSYVMKNTKNISKNIYKVGFVSNNKVSYFNFTYNIPLNKITKIEEV